ncbi:unnamed protein product [Cercopithifilaria johnstoni]|uniref:Unconventional myosin-XV-like domain-containing protein n=1 Tax=Cercopithifilaria johnstoni TaxID=2874296 RepID=A0A8J2LVY4_9BILA|nr:unnamed protein product [Cercopithifilaria johnstoni]
MERHALLCSTPQQSSQPTEESLIRAPSEQSSVSTSIRRMQIPTKASDVDQFLDAIFEQVLPANDLERTDDSHISASMITPTIKGTIANDANETLQSVSQQCLTTTVNYAAQPMMLMLPVNGRMLTSNQQQQENHEQTYDNNTASNGTITATALPSVMPIMMMCMSPTPTTTVTACLSPVSTKNSMVTDNLSHPDDRTLSSASAYQNYNTISSPYSNGTMTSNTYGDGNSYNEHNDGELSVSSTTMIIRSSPLPETAQSPTNLGEKCRVGQIQPTSTKARYIGPVHPQTNECLKSPPLTTKNLHYKQKEQNQLHFHQFDCNKNQFNSIETDKNNFYGTTTRDKTNSGRSAVLSKGNNTSSPSSSYPSLRRIQPYLRSQTPQSPSPPPRLVNIPETEFGTEIIDGREIISNNNCPKLNIYGSAGIRNANVCNTTNSDDIIQRKKLLRTVVEFENDTLKRIGGKGEIIYGSSPATKNVTVSNTINSLKSNKKQQQQQQQQQQRRQYLEQQEMLPYRSESDNESSRTISRRNVEALKEFEGQREILGEWINEMDEGQNHSQTMEEVAIHQDNLTKFQQKKQQQQRVQYYMQDDDYNKQYYQNNIQQQQSVIPYFTQDGQQNEQQRERPAVQYVQQPYDIMIRKQIFHPNEQLGEEQEIDLIFAQIINDCRKPKSYRIHNNERDAVSQILRNYRIPPDLLDNPQLITMDVKIAVIQYARRWPLYFSVQFPVVDHFINRITNEVINARRILSVHESGLTLLNKDVNDDKIELNILDHFK